MNSAAPCSPPLESVGARLGSIGSDGATLQRHLARYGYFDGGVHRTWGIRLVGAMPLPASDTVFCDRLEQALRLFKRFNGLEEIRILDAEKLALMRAPCCEVPDIGEFVLQGNKWRTITLRYGFTEYSPDLPNRRIESEVVRALGLWDAVATLIFTQVAIGQNPEIRIRFFEGDHDDGSSFDGVGGVLAHAVSPPPNAAPSPMTLIPTMRRIGQAMSHFQAWIWPLSRRTSLGICWDSDTRLSEMP